jgi:exopolysaccharide biosynthesis predicted pyruvyltransferase EpsI
MNFYLLRQIVLGLVRRRDSFNCFRTDEERIGSFLPRNNIDLSHVFAYGTDEKKSFFATIRLLRFLNMLNEIRTKRQHITIAAALLGKTVRFYANNYFKCEAVFRYSMESRFPSVKWES